MIRRFGALAFALLFCFPALAQSVQQSGPVTPNTATMWSATGIIKGGNTATDSPLTTFGVTRDAVDAICVNSDRVTAAGRNTLCLQAATSGPAKISLQSFGTASPQNLQFILNGVALTLPSGGGTFLTGSPPFVVGHAACFNSTSGVIQDCGVSVSAGTQFGLPYYSTTSTLSSTIAGTNGQLLLGQTGAAPAWTTLSGDVASVNAAGALTLQKVNGIPFPFTFTAHAVLLGNATGQFGTLITSNVGQCLISQGLNADPIYAACASGSGSAGGSNTQVQFNNSTALAGSNNLTWVSPTLTVGVAAGGTGSLQLCGTTSGCVLIQPQNIAGTYNFNLPTTAGTTGQPLISAGGVASPMTFGTLGIVGGGTNCAAASGTCLDNITGFASVGYVRRAGAGSYTQVTPIPVSDGGTNLASGTSGGVPAYTGSTTITSSGVLALNGLVIGGGAGAVPASITAGTNGQFLAGVTGSPPAMVTMSGDVSTTNAGVTTIANSAVTVAKQANAAAYSLAGNFTGSSTAPQFSTIGTLTQKASPASTDLLVIQDQAAAGQLKFATVSSIAAAGSVGSIAGNTGAFTLGGGLTNNVNVLQSYNPTNAQSGTSYAFVDGDRAKLVTASNSAAQAYTIAQAGASSSSNFAPGWCTQVQNNSTTAAGVVTITATTSQFNNNGTLSSTLAIGPGFFASICSDGTNYQVYGLINKARLTFAWVYFTCTGGCTSGSPAPTVVSNWNVSSVSRASAGNYTINFTVPSPGATSYACTGQDVTASATGSFLAVNGGQTAAAITIQMAPIGGGFADPTAYAYITCNST